MINAVIAEFGREMENLWKDLPGGMIDPLDSMALYSMIRFIKPKTILEIGSLLGKSTCIIAKAIENNECGKLYTCDIEDKSKLTKRNVLKLFPKSNIEFIPGNVESNLDKIPDVDMVFIDGPHNKNFMYWCLENIIPKVKGYVLIHDVNMSYGGNIRSNGDSESDCILEVAAEEKLPFYKVAWMEDWCLNHNFKEQRNILYDDFPMIGKWGDLNRPSMAALSIWKMKEEK